MLDRWREIQRLFREALKLPSARRSSYLDRACDADPELREELRSLLQHHQAAGSFLAPLAEQVPGTTVSARVFEKTTVAGGAAGRPPERIGRYRLRRKIGEGGMGAVYEAVQDNPQRTVAIKLINREVITDRLLKRFQHEAEVLGKLAHPGIAQIFEAGTFDHGDGEQPFFAMEFVEGISLTRFCDRHQLGTRHRLYLVAKAAEAIHHAHAKGVVHRDLKPANILVNKFGKLKILDFGVARATDSDLRTTTLQTSLGQIVGTVPYMSPEQALGDPRHLDRRSDVYAIGVIAYELLAGELPYELEEKPLHEALRVICEVDPMSLGMIDRAYRGDVESIVAKALEKEVPRRYQSAAEMARDIRRHLGDEPISARRRRSGHRLTRLVRRHRVAMSLAVACLLLAAVVVVQSVMMVSSSPAENDDQAAGRTDDGGSEHRGDEPSAPTIPGVLASPERRVEPRSTAGRRAPEAESEHADSTRLTSKVAARRHDGRVTAVAVGQVDSAFVMTGDDRGRIHVWDPAIRAVVGVPMETRVGVVCLELTDRNLVSGHADRSIRMWDQSMGTELFSYELEQPLASLAMSRNGLYLAAPEGTGIVHVWPVGDRPRDPVNVSPLPVLTIRGGLGQFVTLHQGPDGLTCHEWSVDGRKDWSGEFAMESSLVTATLGPEGLFVAAAASDGSIQIWDRSGVIPPAIQAGGTVTTLALGKDGLYIAWALDDGRIVLRHHTSSFRWEGRPRASALAAGRASRVSSLGLAPYGGFVISGHEDGTVIFWK